MPTIHDVAKKAKVSAATVSRVFNGLPEVCAETRARILAAAEALNYQPHVAARNLRRRRQGRRELTYTIGILQEYGQALANNLWSNEILAGVAAAIRGRGYGMRFIAFSARGSVPEEIEQGLVDGVIMLGAWPQMRRIACRLPSVTIDAFDPSHGAYGLVPNYRVGVHEVCLRLLKAGIRRIALTCYDTSPGPGIGFAQQVTAGCHDAHGDLGLEPNIVPLPTSNGQPLIALTPEQGYALGKEWFALPAGQRPEAVIGSDSALLGMYRAAYELGLRIPDNISLVGTDGVSLGEYYLPPLSTVDVHIAALGKRSVAIIADAAAKGELPHGMEMTPVRFVERASARLAPL